MTKASIHNYVDDNTLSCFSNSIPNLIKILEHESSIAISWLNENKMIANPEKFHAIVVTKNINVSINGKNIKSEPWVKLLGIKIDNKLKFDLHIADLCNKMLSYQTKAFPEFQSKIYFNSKFCICKF